MFMSTSLNGLHGGDDEYQHTVHPPQYTQSKLRSNLSSIDVALILLMLKEKSIPSCCETKHTIDIVHKL